jgi:uncharacterized protein
VRFYTTEQLGRSRELTPEGFLLCRDVPIARIGKQQYARGEVPVPPGPDGTIWIEREPEEVFRPETIASFAGKPVVDDHPPLGIKVTPENWARLAKGVTLNPRRGDGVQTDNDFMYADLLITDADLIADINKDLQTDSAGIRPKPKREVSAGYDAEYEETGPGRGRQTDIIGNHVALVDKGRCGPRCAIGDKAMSNRTFKAFRDRIMKMASSGDADGVGEELKKLPDMLGDIVSDAEPDEGDKKTHVEINLHGMQQPGMPAGDKRTKDADGEEPVSRAELQALASRLDDIEEALTMLAEGGDDDDGAEDRRMRDRRMNSRRARDAEKDPDDEDGEKKWKTGDPGSEEKDDVVKDTNRTKDADGEDDEDKEADKTTNGATGDNRRAMVGDSTSLRVPFQEMVSRAEILLPGVRKPTFDSAKTARITTDSMCQYRRHVLAEAWRDADAQMAIEPVLAGKAPIFTDRAMTCDAVATVFAAASAIRANSNNASLRMRGGTGNVVGNGVQRVLSVADINALNRKKYGLAV